MVVSGQPGHFTPRQKAPLYPLDKRPNGPHSQSGCSGEKKRIPAPVV